MSEQVETRGSRRKRRFTVDALFQDTSPRAAGVRDLVDAKEIQLERIVPDPNQPRQTFDDERLAELADSIRIEGILQPLAVRYDEDSDCYVIVHGERRWRAARLAGLRAVPAIVREVPEDRRLIQQLMENVVREDLNAVERASALRALKRQMNDAPWEQVAEAVGIKRSRLFQLLSTEKLPEPVQGAIRAGSLSEKQSRVLQGLEPAAQEVLARMIAEDDLSERVARRLARALREDAGLAALPAGDLAHRLGEMRDSLEARPARRGARRPSISGALRDVFEDDSLPDDPIAAIESVRRANGAAVEYDDSVDERLRMVAIDLARLASNPPAGTSPVTNAQLKALRQLIDFALENSSGHAAQSR
jgi:ParB family transcriptional regulator, chromosome partitioning protein